MGHIEYASPECLNLRDLVTYDIAGDELLQTSLAALGADGMSPSSKTTWTITPAPRLDAMRIIS